VFDTIVEFSGIGEFIRRPLRTYSAGMVMRLAFSVAAHVDSDILIVDEVLAVGDQSFEARCIDRIFELKHSGKTLLFVSHGAPLVRILCDRALWLDQGEGMMDGPAADVVEAYTGQTAAKTLPAKT
jgi:lipopolysaccharide transport system ATP-binding protein